MRLFRIPLAIVAAVLALSLVVVSITMVRSCDFDQINDPGEYTASWCVYDVETSAAKEGVQVDFKVGIRNHGTTPIITYVFVWATHPRTHSHQVCMWPTEAEFRPPPSSEETFGRSTAVMERYKDGYRLDVEAQNRASASARIVIPEKWEGSPPEELGSATELTVVFYDVFGREMTRVHHPYRRRQ